MAHCGQATPGSAFLIGNSGKAPFFLTLWLVHCGSVTPRIRGEVDETTICGEMVTMHRGISESKMMDASARFFDKFFVAQIFPEMRELVRRLQQNGCDVWAVSSTNEWVIRAAMKHFGIPDSRILAAKVELD